MSLTLSTLVPTASASACPMAQIYTLPTTDAACAIPNKPSSNYTDVMAKCCHDAPVTKYANDCGLYCLAAGQSIGGLASCLTGNGVSFGEAFCNKNTTSTATAKISSSGAASKTVTGTASNVKGSATGTAAAASSTGAAAGAYVQQGVSKAGFAVLGLLFLSSAVGALL